jgi:hypothetical protein
MKSFVGVVVGVFVAVMIGCAAKSSAVQATSPTTAAEPGEMAGASPHREIDRLDLAISDEMAKLAVARPTPPPTTCTADCVQQMSGAAAAATAPQPAECRPAQTQTCSDTCKLKSSICENAGRICRIAADLGGTDAYANDKCTSGNASCEVAKQRCCSCM